METTAEILRRTLSPTNLPPNGTVLLWDYLAKSGNLLPLAATLHNNRWGAPRWVAESASGEPDNYPTHIGFMNYIAERRDKIKNLRVVVATEPV